MAVGRFAPSPTGDLHLGNLRTALVAWLFARSAGSRFLVRMEDLDPHQANAGHERSQLADLAALGLDWDGEVVRQSDRFDRYRDAVADLDRRGLVYPCYCTRREIQEAARAPHGPAPDGAYPGTCRHLTLPERSAKEAAGRPAALRLRAQVDELTVTDVLLGTVQAQVDDLVLRRNDGTPAYNLAVVVDDGEQGIEQVVRGDDLASSSPRQRHLAGLLGLKPFGYAHVALVVNEAGERLAKRDGAVTLAELRSLGRSAAEILGGLAESLDLAEPGEPVDAAELVERFDPDRLPRDPWVWRGETFAQSTNV